MNVMRKITQFTAGLVVGLVLGVAAPSSATVPTWAFVGDGGPVVIQVDAPAGSWRIRRASRLLDAQLDGVVFRTNGVCEEADACVRVEVGAYDTAATLRLSTPPIADWAGLATWVSPTERRIYLNTLQGQTGFRLNVAAHELGHVLGLGHNTGGMMDHGGTTLSPDELATLDAYYGVTP